MPQNIIERQQPKYWQGSIKWLTNTEKRRLRRQNIKDAGKWALSSIYNAVTDLPSRVARIPAAWVDQIAWTDIQWTIEDLQSAPSQALKDSASNTKAFDKWSEAANALVWMAALLWAWRMWWTSNTVKFNTSKVKPWTEILKWKDYPAFAQKRYNDWMESINWKPAKSEPEWLYYMWTKESAPDTWLKLTQENVKNNNILKQAWYSDEEIFSLTPSERAKIVDDIETEYIETWPHADAAERWLYEEWWREQAKLEKEAANTSRARAKATKKRNMSAKERAARERAEDSANELAADRLRNEAWNMSLEDMYKYWKSQQNW